MRIRLKSLIPILVTLGGLAASPQVLALLPDKYAHIIAGIGAIVTAFSPAVIADDRPKITLDK